MQTQPISPGGAAEAFYGWTVIQLVLIALGAAIVIAGMIYGMRLAHKRHRAEDAGEERADEAGVEQPEAADPVVAETSAEPVAKEPDADLPIVPLAAKPSPAPEPAVAAVPAPEPEPAPAPPEPAPPPATDLAGGAPNGSLALTTIKGLGPKVAAMLAEYGITRVDQVAALTPDQARDLDIQLGAFTGRMARDRWVDQARLLASGDTAAYEAKFGKLG